MFLFIILLVVPLSFAAGMVTACVLNCSRGRKATATDKLQRLNRRNIGFVDAKSRRADEGRVC